VDGTATAAALAAVAAAFGWRILVVTNMADDETETSSI
jgi:hypothetical protein